jgi:hypothetical protein
LVYRKTGLAVGVHTVEIRWKTTSGVAQIRPVTTIVESAGLLLSEVTV